ncbi:hypothetical protein EVB81_071 [Rhizobium phage RHph_I46]|uniref:Uncharacterized protein n=1 Tax=Rhizobium phage RHph_I1_9 TaxID=2509729 RepID=A0A7S5R9J3_9CAUD|nr:hypothetical protein PP936_gp070 [Rhizobium phage RHph_I1_9]QIG69640.1 hypothetical protein EVB81_071 [Rhizobium phage RHph_I46]QIG70921.1 hypothetical protein EVB92_071 [Rhizobium phage RHph_I9]QIG73507.1 hypothetical protein EVC04_070 [Rhizobium phage RHph_I1_9]QIG76260.1 hypothetical protein EVC25_071 [Rhizobium phage RHph_I34]
MAFTGIHAVCGYAGLKGYNNSTQQLLGSAEWSDNLTTAGTSAKKAGSGNFPSSFGKPVIRFYAAADSWVVVGKPASININTGARHFVKALEHYDIGADFGDTFAWTPVV